MLSPWQCADRTLKLRPRSSIPWRRTENLCYLPLLSCYCLCWGSKGEGSIAPQQFGGQLMGSASVSKERSLNIFCRKEQRDPEGRKMDFQGPSKNPKINECHQMTVWPMAFVPFCSSFASAALSKQQFDWLTSISFSSLLLLPTFSCLPPLTPITAYGVTSWHRSWHKPCPGWQQANPALRTVVFETDNTKPHLKADITPKSIMSGWVWDEHTSHTSELSCSPVKHCNTTVQWHSLTVSNQQSSKSHYAK